MNSVKKALVGFLLTAVLLLQGCTVGRVTAERTTTAVSTAVSTATETASEAAAETTAVTTTATTAGTTVPPYPTETVTWLNCGDMGDLPAVLPASGETLLLVGADGDSTVLRLLDPFADTVLASRIMDGRWTVSDDVFSDGSCAVYDWERGLWRFLDASLADDGDFAGVHGGVFSHDRSRFYYAKDLRLMEVRVADGTERDITPAGLRVTDAVYLDRADEALTILFQNGIFGGELCTAVIDLTDGAITMLEKGFCTPSDIGDGVLLMSYGESGFDLRAAPGGDPFRYYPSTLFDQWERDLSVVTGMPMLLSAGAGSTLWNLRGGLSACELADYGIRDMVRFCRRVGETDFVVGGVFHGGAPALFLLNTARLVFAPAEGGDEIPSPFTVDEALLAEAVRLPDELPVADSLRPARELADRVGEEYGIRIVLSDQCLALEPVTSDGLDPTSVLSADEELSAVLSALEQLEAVLGLYPDGFFRQMRNEYGDGGVIIGLTASIHYDYPVNGMTYDRAPWQVILVDVTAWSQNTVFAHELWHATENVIRGRVDGAFDADEWMACNPEGFVYDGSPLAEVTDQTRWTLFHEDDENVYFVDTYGRTNEMEDRARIMETVMTMDVTSQYLLRSPAIRRKLEIMCGAVRAGFDSDGWTDVKWERWMK